MQHEEFNQAMEIKLLVWEVELSWLDVAEKVYDNRIEGKIALYVKFWDAIIQKREEQLKGFFQFNTDIADILILYTPDISRARGSNSAECQFETWC